MSVIGIDFGNESCYVAVARAGGIETVANDYSQRATPSYVAFGERQRYLGEAAKSQYITNLKNTFTDFKKMLGLSFDDDYVASLKEKSYIPYKILSVDGMAGVEATCYGEVQHLNPVQLTAMLLTKLKETTEADIQAKVHDCVISVPSFFTDIQRRCLLAAAHIAGLNVFRLLNETTASCLAYGIYHQDLPEAEDKGRNVVFVDCGHSSLQVCICAFNKGKLKMISSAFDQYLGGRDFDAALATHFCNEFKQKYKIDVMRNPKAYTRLTMEVQKLKKQMSTNSATFPLNIECLMEDRDVSSNMCRADFESLCQPLLQNVENVLLECLMGSKLAKEDIHSVQIVGGSTRIPAIKVLIEKVFGKSPLTKLNQDEAVARGCALMCAILSPAFKVRDFSVTDIQPYPIKAVWGTGSEDSLEAFPKFHPIPFTRMLTFHRKEPFQIRVVYSDKVPIKHPELGGFLIKDVTPNSDGEFSKVKVKVRINKDGVFCVPSATLSTAEAEVPTEESNESMDTEQQNATNQENSSEPNKPTEKNVEKTEDSEMKEKDAPEAVKKKFVLTQIPVECHQPGYQSQSIDKMFQIESEYCVKDRKEKARADSRNTLEEYIYELRDKLSAELAQFVQEPIQDCLRHNLDKLEDWLYEEGDDVSKSVYQDKLTELKGETDPIVMRKREFEERRLCMKKLEEDLVGVRKVVELYAVNDERYQHLDQAEVKKLESYVQEETAWLDNVRSIYHDFKLFNDPPIKADEIKMHSTQLKVKAEPIINKPKPKVEPPKDPKSDDKNVDEKKKAPSDAKNSNEAPKAGDEAMDVD